jgi:hypothetical protein
MSNSSSGPSNIADKLKQTIDELEIDRHVNDLVIQVENALTTARDKVATLAAEHGDDVERFLDKVSTTIDERTEGRFAPQVDKVRTTVSSGVSRLAEHRPAETTPDAAPGSASTWPVDEIEPPSAE